MVGRRAAAQPKAVGLASAGTPDGEHGPLGAGTTQPPSSSDAQHGARCPPIGPRTSVALLTDDSQIGANLRVCADEENRADFDQRR